MSLHDVHRMRPHDAQGCGTRSTIGIDVSLRSYLVLDGDGHSDAYTRPTRSAPDRSRAPFERTADQAHECPTPALPKSLAHAGGAAPTCSCSFPSAGRLEWGHSA